jgi:hypothetical protein
VLFCPGGRDTDVTHGWPDFAADRCTCNARINVNIVEGFRRLLWINRIGCMSAILDLQMAQGRQKSGDF